MFFLNITVVFLGMSSESRETLKTDVKGGQKAEQWLRTWETLILILALSLACQVTLNKSFHCSIPQFPHL